MFQLYCQAMNGKCVPLPSGELVLVGRGDNCGVTIDDPSASRIHCRLLARDGKVFLTDAGSRWGTLVNGRRVVDCELRPGDEITIGETVLRLEATGTPNGTTLARQSEVKRRFHSGDQLAPPAVMLPGPATGGASVPDSVLRLMAAVRDAYLEDRAVEPSGGRMDGRCYAGCRLRRRLALSSTGEVFLATSLTTHRDVALKVFHASALCEDVDRERFVRSTELIRGLRHPHLVELLEAGVEQEQCYTVSEFVEGESAAALIQRIGVVGMLDWRTTLQIGRDIVSALEFAHEQGIVHRNITPRNILIRKSDGVALLNDLLLAKSLEDDAAARLTEPGELIGAIPFLSPEQVGSGQPVDQRSDLYQLGATLYALLTGKPPVDGRDTQEVVQNILSEPPQLPTLTHLSVPAMLEGVIMRLLEKRPDDRFASARVVQRELDRVSKYLGE